MNGHCQLSVQKITLSNASVLFHAWQRGLGA
jgi:hypothetical protein